MNLDGEFTAMFVLSVLFFFFQFHFVFKDFYKTHLETSILYLYRYIVEP